MVGSVKYRFSPSEVEIGQGGSVTWQWVAGIHNVVGDSAGSPINEPDPISEPGHTYTATFPAKGTFAFHCDVHPADMQGTVTVR